MKHLLLLTLLLLTSTAYAADPLWHDIQARWKGTLRVQESICKVSKLRETIIFRVTGRSEEEESLIGRTPSRRYLGYVWGSDEEDGVSASFGAYTPVRMTSGRVCRMQLIIEYLYSGGNVARVRGTKTVFCSGAVVCRTRSAGVLRKRGK